MLLAHPWPGPSIFMPRDFYNEKCYPCLFAKYHISSSKLRFAKKEKGAESRIMKIGKKEKNVLLEEDALGERDEEDFLKDKIEQGYDGYNDDKSKSNRRPGSSFPADQPYQKVKEQDTRKIKAQEGDRNDP